MARRATFIRSATCSFALLIVVSAYLSNAQAGQEAETKAGPSVVERAGIGGVRVVFKCGNLWLASQPSVEDLKLLADAGVQCVVTFRTDEEVEWDEQAEVEKAGMQFRSIPFSTIESLTDEVFDETRKMLRDSKDKPLFLHCGAAVRVAAVWAAYRVLDEGVSLEVALAEAEKVGLRSPKLRECVEQYIRAKK
jgi:uncharacterized protein (TIGR01244 family)